MVNKKEAVSKRKTEFAGYAGELAAHGAYELAAEMTNISNNYDGKTDWFRSGKITMIMAALRDIRKIRKGE